MLTATAPIIATAVVIAGVGVYAGVGVPLTELPQNVLVLVVIAECSLRVAEGRTELVNVLRLNEVSGDLVLFDNGCLEIAAARLHLGPQSRESQLILVAVLKNLLLCSAVARKNIAFDLRKILSNRRSTVTSTTKEPVATERKEEQENQDDPEKSSGAPTSAFVVVLQHFVLHQFGHVCHV